MHPPLATCCACLSISTGYYSSRSLHRHHHAGEIALKKIVASSRFLISAASLGAFVASLLLILVALAQLVGIIVVALKDFSTVVTDPKSLTVAMVNNIDLFLLSAGFYIIGLGFYELFVDGDIPMPEWLEIHDFEDLKSSLVSIIIVVIAVSFLGQVINWKSGTDIAALGVSVGLVIAALTYFLSVKAHKKAPKQKAPASEAEDEAGGLA
jgi:uncharacterized membrane protein YqhA